MDDNRPEEHELDEYEQNVLHQARRFQKKIAQTSSFQQWTKQWQQKIDGYVPPRVHQTLASALEKGIKAFLAGIDVHAQPQLVEATGKHLRDLLPQARQIVQDYTKLASIEGAGTGFGGIIASGIDFPALISIKLKMLQELTALYGYKLQDFRERLYVIKLMQLEFSGKDHKRNVWRELKGWTANREQLLKDHADMQHGSDVQYGQDSYPEWDRFNWERFYLEYKQSIELLKLLQIIPGFGAIVGAYANFTFVEQLGSTSVLCLQLRRLQEQYGHRIIGDLA